MWAFISMTCSARQLVIFSHRPFWFCLTLICWLEQCLLIMLHVKFSMHISCQKSVRGPQLKEMLLHPHLWLLNKALQNHWFQHLLICRETHQLWVDLQKELLCHPCNQIFYQDTLDPLLLQCLEWVNRALNVIYRLYCFLWLPIK